MDPLSATQTVVMMPVGFENGKKMPPGRVVERLFLALSDCIYPNSLWGST